jgi:DNA-binding response OmpR family regulator
MPRASPTGMDASQHPRPSAPPLLVYQFGGFTLDPARGALSRPTGTGISLRPTAAEPLRHLVDNAGRVVPREELMQAVWGDVFVTDDPTSTQRISIPRRKPWGIVPSDKLWRDHLCSR